MVKMKPVRVSKKTGRRIVEPRHSPTQRKEYAQYRKGAYLPPDALKEMRTTVGNKRRADYLNWRQDRMSRAFQLKMKRRGKSRKPINPPPKYLRQAMRNIRPTSNVFESMHKLLPRSVQRRKTVETVHFPNESMRTTGYSPMKRILLGGRHGAGGRRMRRSEMLSIARHERGHAEFSPRDNARMTRWQQRTLDALKGEGKSRSKRAARNYMKKVTTVGQRSNLENEKLAWKNAIKASKRGDINTKTMRFGIMSHTRATKTPRKEGEKVFRTLQRYQRYVKHVRRIK